MGAGQGEHRLQLPMPYLEEWREHKISLANKMSYTPAYQLV